MDKLNDQQFKQLKGEFVTSVREMWANATKLAVAAIMHYHDTTDTGRIAEVYEAFASAKGDKLLGAFESSVYAMTNVKFRQPEDLKQSVKCITKGSNPTDWSTQLAALEKNGLAAKVRGLKSKALAKRLNNDGKRPESSNESGGYGADESLLNNLSEDQKKLVTKAQDEFNEWLKALAAGDKAEPPKFEGAGIEAPAGLAPEQRGVLSSMMDDFAMLYLKAPDKFNSITKSVTNDLKAALTRAEKAAVQAAAGATGKDKNDKAA